MHGTHPSLPDENNPSLPSANRPLAFGCGCLFSLAFILAGLLPIAALMNILPRAEYFGNQPLFPVVSAGLAFLAVGMSMLINIFLTATGGQRLSGRVIADLIAFFLAIPFHWWLFFGKPDKDAVTGLGLGVITLFTTSNLPLNFILAKIATAVICLIIDLYLISEIFGLGWFYMDD
jgi:hypothetical protein